jgi:hypothetical protein
MRLRAPRREEAPHGRRHAANHVRISGCGVKKRDREWLTERVLSACDAIESACASLKRIADALSLIAFRAEVRDKCERNGQ